MALSELTSRDAVLAAIEEFRRLGREAFLTKYGFGPSRKYLISYDGGEYDSKAVAGAAYGYQFPDRGPLRAADFSGGEETVQPVLERLGFQIAIHNEFAGAITARDIALIRESRTHARYAELSVEERAAYARIHNGLKRLGDIAAQALASYGDFVVKPTSGFHPKSGVRGFLPKDLWFGVSNVENSDVFVGMPQLFLIVSDRGIEYGLAAAIAPQDFTQPSIREQVREAAPKIFSSFPNADSEIITTLQENLQRSGQWFFRRKTRLDPGVGDFSTMKDWLAYLKSPTAIAAASGAISRYISEADLAKGHVDLSQAVLEAARLFGPLLRVVVPSVESTAAACPSASEAGSAFWIFQANPAIFDVDSAVQQLHELTWTVRDQAERNAAVGDKVFLWRSGKDAGIVAVATIVDRAKNIEAPDTEQPFFIDKARFSGPSPRVRLRTNLIVSPPLLRSTIAAEPRLKDLSILKFAQTGAFRVPPVEAEALMELLDDAATQALPDEEQVWLYAPGQNAEYWDEFYQQEVMAIGWESLGDLSQYKSIDELVDSLKTDEGRRRTNAARVCFDFVHSIKKGDLVFVKRGRSTIIGFGFVTGDYRYDPNLTTFPRAPRKILLAKSLRI